MAIVKRERLEDLGKIAVLISRFLEEHLQLFEGDHACTRPKDFVEYFRCLSTGAQEDLLRSIAYDTEYSRWAIGDILEIAEGSSGEEI